MNQLLSFFLLYFVGLFNLGGQAHATATPEIMEWIAEAPPIPRENFVPVNLMVVKSFAGTKTTLQNLPKNFFDRSTCFQLLTNETLQVFLEANQNYLTQNDASGAKLDPQMLMTGVGAEIMFLPNQNFWQVYIHFATSKNSKFIRKEIASPKEITAAVIAPLLSQVIGYSGYVIAQKTEFFLVAEFGVAPPDTQAIVIDDSANRSLLVGNHKILFLIEKVSSKESSKEGGFAIYRSLMGESGASVIPGTKILHQSYASAK